MLEREYEEAGEPGEHDAGLVGPVDQARSLVLDSHDLPGRQVEVQGGGTGRVRGAATLLVVIHVEVCSADFVHQEPPLGLRVVTTLGNGESKI